VYEQVLAVEPGEKNALVSLAEINLRMGGKQKALLDLEKARNLYPNFIAPRILLAQIYIQDRDILKARPVVNEAVNLDSADLRVQELQGVVLLASGNAKKALSVISDLVKSSPTADHYYQLAQAQRAVKKPNDALSSLDNGLKKVPNHMPSLTLKSFIYNEMGKPRDAIKVYEKIIAQYPNNAFAFNNIANLYLDVDKDKALDYAKKAYQLDKSAPYADTLGWVLFKSGDVSQSLLHLSAAHDAAKDNLSISYHLAAALAKAGQKVGAKELLEKIVSANQGFPEVRDAKVLLATLK
jgi:tetratricopeptide (TPR) repeat protein